MEKSIDGRQIKRRTCYAVGHFVDIPLEGRLPVNQYKVVLTDQLYLIIKHFYPNGSGQFYDASSHIHRAQGLTEGSNDYII